MTICSRCKKSSPIEQLFIKIKSKGLYCPRCAYEEITLRGKRTWAILLIGLVASFIGSVYYPDSQLCFFGLIWFGWGIAIFVGISIHEMAHYVSARLLGGHCPKVSFGEGGLIYAFHSKHTIWELRASPYLGVTYVAFPEKYRQLWRYLTVLVSGGLANLLVAVAVYLWLHFDLFGNRNEIMHVLLVGLGVINSFLFGAAFWPRKIRGRLISDGLMILNILKNNPDVYDRLYWGYQLNTMSALMAREEHDNLIDFVKSYENYELSPVHCESLTLAYYNLGRYDEGLEYANRALDLLEQYGKDCLPPGSIVEVFKATSLNNLAFGLYVIQSQDVDRILGSADYAYEILPWNDAIVSTWASIQVEYGNLEEGIAFLERLVSKKSETGNGQSYALAYASLAIGYRKAGNVGQMKRAVNMSKALDPQCPLLSRLS